MNMFGVISFQDRFKACEYLRTVNGTFYTYILKYKDVPFYVGISKNWKRIHAHFSDNKKRVNPLLRRKLRKIKTEKGTVQIDIVNHYVTQTDLYLAEINLINFYGRKIDRTGTLCNLSAGGEGARFRTSKKQVLAAKNANTGRIVSTETRRKLSEALKETFKTREGTFKGKKHSEQTRQKMSDNNSGENHPQYGLRGENHFNFGKKHSLETITKIKESQSKIDMSCTAKRKEQLQDYWKNQPLLVCPHCGKTSTFKPAMIRFHFENCKHK